MAERKDPRQDDIASEKPMDATVTEANAEWFVLRDLKRPNAKWPAYKMLPTKGIEAFTPTKMVAVGKGKNCLVEEVPVIFGLLFAHSSRAALDPIIDQTDTLQYRYVHGGWKRVMIVRDEDMERFKYAVEHAEIKEFFSIDALPKELIGEKVIVHGGPLDGYEVTLRKMRGTKKRRIFIELSGMAYAELELTGFISLETCKE